jgi:hypothetical protein
MNTKRLKEETKQFIAKYPEHSDEIKDLYYLALDEIMDGGSESHECELALESMRQLVEGEE